MNNKVSILTLKCPSCGADLEISPDVDTFACGYCGTQQMVQRRGGTVSLKLVGEAIARVQVGTDRTAAELALRRLQDEIATMQLERQQLQSQAVQIEPWRAAAPAVCLVLGMIITFVLGSNGYMELMLFALLITVTVPLVVISSNASPRNTAKVKRAEVDRQLDARIAAAQSEINEHRTLLSKRNA